MTLRRSLATDLVDDAAVGAAAAPANILPIFPRNDILSVCSGIAVRLVLRYDTRKYEVVGHSSCPWVD